MEIIGRLIILILASIGFGIASYIRGKKHKEAPLVCPLEGSCETVVHSEYSKFLGIPLELWGMAYYGSLSLFYAISFILPGIPENISYIVLGISALAFLFSLYLTFIQAVIIHHWCTWCLFSAGISTLIFICSLVITNKNLFFALVG